MTLHPLSRDQIEALRQFARSQIDLDELLLRLNGLVDLSRRDLGNREIKSRPMPDGVVAVSGDDVRWVLERYVRGKISGEDLATWAGLLLAIPAYTILEGQKDEAILDLLHDLAMPLSLDYLDREVLKARIASVWKDNRAPS